MNRLVFAAMLLAVLAAVPVAASAGVPQAVSISVTKGLGDFTPGSFTASGGITDSGTYQLLEEHDAAIPSPVVGTNHFTFSLAGALGTITMKGETLFTVASTSPPVFVQNGSWLIVSGTGAYARLEGEGRFHKVIDVTLGLVTITLTGKVH